MHLLSIKQNFFLSSCFFSAAETKTKSEHTTQVIYSEFPFFCSPGYGIPDSTVWPYQLLQTNSSAVAEEYWLFPYLCTGIFWEKGLTHVSGIFVLNYLAACLVWRFCACCGLSVPRALPSSQGCFSLLLYQWTKSFSHEDSWSRILLIELLNKERYSVPFSKYHRISAALKVNFHIGPV